MIRICRISRVFVLAFYLPLTANAQSAADSLLDGVIQLDARAATIQGQHARFLVLEDVGNICYWTDPDDWLAWDCTVERTGQYVLELKYSCNRGSEGSTFDVNVGSQTLRCEIARNTGTWYDHERMILGRLELDRSARYEVTLKPTHKPGQAVMNLAWMRLIPAEQFAAYLNATPTPRRYRGNYTGSVFVMPNFHPASCGWLTDFSTERNYCSYSYLDHLGRVRSDPNYCFSLSEVNNIIAIMAFEPERVEEIKQRIPEGRVELVNAFFLEPTINLSGGEALVKMGVEGLRWQQQVMGARPRLVWAIDVTGVHEQMAQIAVGRGRRNGL